MDTTTFDRISRNLGSVSTRRGMLRLLGGAAALGAGLALSAQDETLGKGRGKGNGREQVSAQGKSKKLTICYQGQTKLVKKSKLDTFPGATKGACPGGGQRTCRAWVLSGGAGSNDPISVDDDLQVTLNGAEILKNDDKMAGTIPALRFTATPGDSLGVVATDVHAACRSLSPLWLHCETTGQRRQLSPGQPDGCAPGRTPGVFFSQTFRVEL
jgi:hypothetical protein